MNIVTLDCGSIDPFVRYSHFFHVDKTSYLSTQCAYEYRMLYVTSGDGMMRVDDREYALGAGTLLVWRPGVPYKFLPSEEGMMVYAINFDMTGHYSREKHLPIVPDVAGEFDREQIVEIADFSDAPRLNDTVYIPCDTELEKYFYNIDNAFLARKNFSPVYIKGQFLMLIYKILGHLVTDDTNKITVGNGLIDAMIAYIKENYSREISNKKMGESFNFHPAHINRIFLKNTGCSLHRYIIIYRLNIALNLLQTTSGSIAEICLRVGFKDPNYFSRCFKRYFGTSPSSYRHGEK